MQLYRRRMAQAKREGGGNAAILKALAQEWASFPTASGEGYYPGQRASVTPSAVLRAVEAEEAGKNRSGGTSGSLPMPQAGRSAMSPGGFDLNSYLRSQPMGATTNTDNRRNNDINLKAPT